MYELTKTEKKVARAAIDKGLDAEFKEGLENFETIIQDWRQGEFASNKEVYHKIVKLLLNYINKFLLSDYVRNIFCCPKQLTHKISQRFTPFEIPILRLISKP